MWNRDAVMNEGWGWGLGAGLGLGYGTVQNLGTGWDSGCRKGVRMQPWVQDRILGTGLRVWYVGQNLGCSTQDLGCRWGLVHISDLSQAARECSG